MAPPIDPIHIQRHVGDIIGFGAVGELVMIVIRRVPVNAQTSGADLEGALLYGNHSRVAEHMPTIWETLVQEARRQNFLVREKPAAHKFSNFGACPLAAVGKHKVLKFNYF